MVPSTALAKNMNTPVTSWMNLFPALSSAGASSGGFAYCTFAPYVFLIPGCGWFCGFMGGDAGNAGVPFGYMLALTDALFVPRSPI